MKKISLINNNKKPKMKVNNLKFIIKHIVLQETINGNKIKNIFPKIF